MYLVNKNFTLDIPRLLDQTCKYDGLFSIREMFDHLTELKNLKYLALGNNYVSPGQTAYYVLREANEYIVEVIQQGGNREQAVRCREEEIIKELERIFTETPLAINYNYNRSLVYYGCCSPTILKKLFEWGAKCDFTTINGRTELQEIQYRYEIYREHKK